MPTRSRTRTRTNSTRPTWGVAQLNSEQSVVSVEVAPSRDNARNTARTLNSRANSRSFRAVRLNIQSV